MNKYFKVIRNLFSVVFFCFLSLNSYGQKIATFEVDLSKETYGIYVPVCINLDAVTFVSDTVLTLVEIRDNHKLPVAFQIEQGTHRTLHWMVKPESGNGGKHIFELIKSTPGQVKEEVMATAKDGTLTLHYGDQNLLRYYYKTLYPPEGVDTAFKRSGFIHPLWSPNGQVLTRIQPPDHYHHYGIWNPWTQVLFEGEKIDFWNLAKREATVRFANFVSIQSGSLFSGFEALHEHVVFKKDGSEKIALNELQSVRVYKPQDSEDYFIADFVIQLNCATESPVLILEYRYAGFGWRTTEAWNKDNSEVLTSEGKTRKDADGSTARWCIVQGSIDEDYAGVVMISYPTNYNYPEPLRIWPETQNGRGDMFANFCPTKNTDWLLEPGQKYVLKYRLLVFNNHLSKEKAEAAWQYFASPPKISIIMDD
jgi:hypothetical protein